MPVSKDVVEQQLRELRDFHQFFTSKEIRYLPEILATGETIYGITSGFFEAKTWIIVVTDLRLLFLDKGMFYGLKQIDMPLSKISSVSQKTGLIFGEIEVATTFGSKKISSIPRKSVIKIASILASLIHGRIPGEPDAESALDADSPATSKGKYIPADLASQLERLDVLYQKGVLTDEEFRLSKAKLLLE